MRNHRRRGRPPTGTLIARITGPRRIGRALGVAADAARAMAARALHVEAARRAERGRLRRSAYAVVTSDLERRPAALAGCAASDRNRCRPRSARSRTRPRASTSPCRKPPHRRRPPSCPPTPPASTSASLEPPSPLSTPSEKTIGRAAKLVGIAGPDQGLVGGERDGPAEQVEDRHVARDEPLLLAPGAAISREDVRSRPGRTPRSRRGRRRARQRFRTDGLRRRRSRRASAPRPKGVQSRAPFRTKT